MAYERLNLKQDDLLDEAVFKHIDDSIETIHNDLYLSAEELLDISALIEGNYIIPQTGLIGKASGYACTDYLPVTPGRTIKLKLGCKNGSNVGCAWYNASKGFISGFNIHTVNENMYVVPEGAYYMRGTQNPNYLAHEDAFITVQAEERLDTLTELKTKVADIELYYEHAADTSLVSPGLLNATTGTAGYTNTTREDYRYCAEYFPVTPGTTISVQAFCQGAYAAIIYYDTTKAFLSSVASSTHNLKDYEVPSGAAYVRICSERYTISGLKLKIGATKTLPDIAVLQEQIDDLSAGAGGAVEQPMFLPDRTQTIIGEVSSSYVYSPSTPPLEIKYKGELNPEKRYLAIGFDDFRASDFSLIIPLFNKYNARATFNHIKRGTSITDTMKTQVNNVVRSGHELGDHTWLHYKYPFDEPLFNGQDPSALEGGQVPFPSNDQLRNDRGDGKNVFGKVVTAAVSATMSYQGPGIDTAWANLTDDECQIIRNHFSVMKDTSTNIISILDYYSNLYLGTAGDSKGSWSDSEGCYTGGIFTGCKTSANHEIWERIMLITALYYKIGYNLNYNVITWSLPGSKASGCYFHSTTTGDYYYDEDCTIYANNLARMTSSLYTNHDGTPKSRSWTEVLYEFGYRMTHDATCPGRIDGQSTPAMRTQLIYNAFMSRKHALPYYTDRLLSYSTVAKEFTEDMFNTETPLEVQMYDLNTTNSFYKAIENWRLNMSNGMIQGEVIDSVDSWSERTIFEHLLRYCVETGVEVISKAEAYDICFNHKLRTGNLIYNPRLRNTAKEFLPTATTVPTNPDGYTSGCSVEKDSAGCPVLTTTKNVTYKHLGIPTGCNITYSADVKGSGTITITTIRNNSTSETVATLTASDTSAFDKLTGTFYIEDADLTDYEQRCMGYGEKIMGIKIVYSSGLEIKNISLTADC